MKYALIKKTWGFFALGVGLLAMLTYVWGSNRASQAQIKQICFAKSEALVKFLPEKAGELKKRPNFQFFTRDRLFDYINGGAEDYLKNGFALDAKRSKPI